jgi:RNA polymerase sigma-70 factor (ECF subfamily)
MPVEIASPKSQDPEQFRSRLTRYIRHIVRDAGEGEDLAQETLLRAHLQQGSLRDSQALESWLFKTATHVSIDRIRQRAGTVERHLQTPVEDLPLADRDRPSPFVIVEQDEMSQCVQRYLAELSDAYKAVLLLHDVDKLTAAEIAELLQLPATTVKMRLHRARKRLQALLKDACEFDRDDRGVFVCEPKPDSRGRLSSVR